MTRPITLSNPFSFSSPEHLTLPTLLWSSVIFSQNVLSYFSFFPCCLVNFFLLYNMDVAGIFCTCFFLLFNTVPLRDLMYTQLFLVPSQIWVPNVHPWADFSDSSSLMPAGNFYLVIFPTSFCQRYTCFLPALSV